MIERIGSVTIKNPVTIYAYTTDTLPTTNIDIGSTALIFDATTKKLVATKIFYNEWMEV